MIDWNRYEDELAHGRNAVLADRAVATVAARRARQDAVRVVVAGTVAGTLMGAVIGVAAVVAVRRSEPGPAPSRAC